MAGKKLFRTNLHPYHVTFRANNKKPFSIDPGELWNLYSNYLHFISHAFNVKINAFVQMSNHAHLLISTPEKNLDSAMNYFLRETSRSINYVSKTCNHIYGGPYKWTLITEQRYYFNVLRYVYQNPVRAGMIERVEQYKFSSLPGLLGHQHLAFPVTPWNELGDWLFKDTERFLEWLNTPVSEAHNSLIKVGLRKREFDFYSDTIATKENIFKNFT